MLIKTTGGFLGKDLTYVEGPLTIEITDEGVIGSISTVGSCSLGTGEVLDLRGYVILPPLANLHVHMLDYAILESGWDLDIDSLVGEPYGLKYVLLRKLDSDALKETVCRARRLNWIHGIGIIVEFRELGLKGTMVDRDVRVTGHLVLSMPSTHGPESMSEASELIELSDGLGISSPLYFSEEVLESLIRLCRRKGKYTVAHVAETQETHARGDLCYLISAGGADAVVHGTYLSGKDVEVLKNSGSSIIICPRANLWFSGRFPPLKELYQAGVQVGIGTDNMGWLKPDLWRDMELVFTLLRNQGIADPRWVLKAGTTACEIFGIENYVDEGMPANLLLLSSEHLGIKTVRNKWLAVIKRGGAEAVGALVVGGVPRYCSGEGEALCSNLRYLLSRR